MDQLTVRVEQRPGVTSDVAATAGPALRALVKNRIGVTVAVHVTEPDGIERSQGKMRRIVDDR
jgi:phenylacetate-CoA ligase